MLELLQLFFTFFFIGMFSFGGGASMMALIEQQVVTNHQWLTSPQLYQFIGIAESTPGPIAVNVATFIGYSQYGVLGSFFATLGVVLPSFIIIYIIARLFANLVKNKYVQIALKGIKPVIIGLIIAMALKIMFVNIFGSFSFGTDLNFDVRQLLITGILLVVYFLYKLIFKKSIHPILLIILAALTGIIVYI